MATSPQHLLAAGAFALAALGLCNAQAFAAPETNHPKAADVLKAKKAKPAKGKKKAVAAPAEDDWAPAEEAEPDITDTKVTEYNCELNNKVTIYANEGDDSHIALRWKKRVHRLERVGTTTGAKRFENTNFRLIWIGIPSKGLLLDSRLNRQLANECKNAEQDKFVDGKPVEAKPVEAAPLEVKPVEVKAVDVKPVEAKPLEATPAEAKPVEATPAGAKPLEVKPLDVKPLEAAPPEPKPVEAAPVETKPAVVAGTQENKI
jgi:membrane-bound inhibitor of C-type lysozyme